MTRSPKITRACPFCGEHEYLRLEEGHERERIVDGEYVKPVWKGSELLNVDYVDGVWCEVCGAFAYLDTWNGTRPAEHYRIMRGDEGPSAPASPADRLRQARIAKGYDQASDAAAAFGWNRNTYLSNENGNAPFSYKKAQAYAQAFGVAADWLYSRGSA